MTEQGNELQIYGEDSEQVIRDTLAKVDQERQQKSSYFELVPPPFQDAVLNLAMTNFPHYQSQFGDVRSFLEAMSRNWLAKHHAFGTLAEQSGMRPYKQEMDGTEVTNKGYLAALTRSASYVLTGPGTFDREGAAMRYVRIPLREGEDVSNITMESGVKLQTPPEEGKPMIFNIGIRTSPLVSVYIRDGLLDSAAARTETINTFNETMTQSFHGIDMNTMRPKK